MYDEGIYLKIFFLTAAIIILLLLWSVKIVYEIKINNFDFSAVVKLRLPFEREVFNSKNQKENKAEKEPENKKQKIDIDTLKKLKAPASEVLAEICRLLKRQCRIVKMDTAAMVALDDPMENGIAFGIISGVLNVISAVLQDKCRAKRVALDIRSDFNSGEGLLFESKGILKINPVITVFAVLLNFKLIREIKNILEILKTEEKKNG